MPQHALFDVEIFAGGETGKFCAAFVFKAPWQQITRVCSVINGALDLGMTDMPQSKASGGFLQAALRKYRLAFAYTLDRTCDSAFGRDLALGGNSIGRGAVCSLRLSIVGQRQALFWTKARCICGSAPIFDELCMIHAGFGISGIQRGNLLLGGAGLLPRLASLGQSIFNRRAAPAKRIDHIF